MEGSTDTKDRTEREPKASDLLPPDAPDGLKAAADGEDLPGADEGEQLKAEFSALDYLTGATKALTFDVPVRYDTEEGEQEIKFRIRQLDGARIIEIEDENTQGAGPFAKLDDVAFNAALVAEATEYIEDATGKREEIKGAEFLGGVPDPAEAMRIRFKFQSGLLAGVAGEVRRVSGYAPGRVQMAQKVLQRAVGN